MADADRIAIRFEPEGTFGTAPGGNWKNLRLTSESLRQDTTTVNSSEIRSDRQVADVVRTAVQGAGAINFEFSAGVYDDLLQYALMSAAWTSTPSQLSLTVTITTATANQFLITDDGTDGFANVNVGDWILIAGATLPANNGVFKVIIKPNNDSIEVAGGSGAADAAEAITVDIFGKVVNGTAFQSIALEKEYTDLSSEFVVYTGMGIDQLSLTVQADSIVTGSFEFIGQDAVSANATAAGTPTGPATNEIIAAVDDVVKILEGSTAAARYVEVDAQSFGFTLANNLRARMNIGDLGPFSLGTGSIGLTGTLQQYYETKSAMDKHLAFTETAIAIVIQDSSSPTQYYVFDFPRIHFTSGQRVAGGQNQDIIADMSWSAFRQVPDDVTVGIHRLPIA